MNFFKSLTLCLCAFLLCFSCSKKEKTADIEDNTLEEQREQLREAKAKEDAEKAAEQQRLADEAVEEFEAKEKARQALEMKLAEEKRLQEEKIE